MTELPIDLRTAETTLEAAAREYRSAGDTATLRTFMDDPDSPAGIALGRHVDHREQQGKQYAKGALTALARHLGYDLTTVHVVADEAQDILGAFTTKAAAQQYIDGYNDRNPDAPQASYVGPVPLTHHP